MAVKKGAKKAYPLQWDWLGKSWVKWIPALVACLLYANTLTHDYTLDDAIVITENSFTKQGLNGLKGLFTYDTFNGFFNDPSKASLVSGGRYRPFTPAMFAIEYALWGPNPFFGHLINILLYACLGLVLFLLAQRIFTPLLSITGAKLAALVAALFFVVHPLHTEAVANIKGRDEIMAFLGSALALWLLVKPALRIMQLFGASLVFFIALLSKENAFLLVLLGPALFSIVFKWPWSKVIQRSWMLWIPGIIFILIRQSVLGFTSFESPLELMNNPFLKFENGSLVPMGFHEKLGTILRALSYYLKLMIIPYPLTHDYYPRFFPVTGLFHPLALLAGALFSFWWVVVFVKLRSWPIFAWGSLWFLLGLGLVSNLFFPVGTHLSERFLFIPSFGLCLMAGMAADKAVHSAWLKAALGLTSAVLLSFTVLTITRNPAWKDNFTLFRTDIKHSPESAKLNNALGGELSVQAVTLYDSLQRIHYLQEAIPYLQKALEIYPLYSNAYLLLGNCYFHLKDFPLSIRYYNSCLQVNPGSVDAKNNLHLAYREGGKFFGETKGDLTQARQYLEQAFALNPADYETNRLCGVVYGVIGDHQKALTFFETAYKMDPNNKGAQENYGRALINAGRAEEGTSYLNKAANTN